MKKLILAVSITTCALSVLAQGTVIFGNHISGAVVAPVYGPQLADATQILTGNTATGIPAGSQVYTGALLAGGAYDVQLWAGPDVNSLAAVSAVKNFATGAGAGYYGQTTETIPTVAPLGTAQLQIRAWDNMGGTVTTWDQAVTAGADRGLSTIFASQPLGGGINPAPNLVGLTSFNIHAVPEPSTFALAGLGVAALLIFRRRK